MRRLLFAPDLNSKERLDGLERTVGGSDIAALAGAVYVLASPAPHLRARPWAPAAASAWKRMACLANAQSAADDSRVEQMTRLSRVHCQVGHVNWRKSQAAQPTANYG